MFRWLARMCGSLGETEDVEKDPERLRDEIRRLDELLRAYQDFGYEEMAADCAQRKASLQEELRRRKAGAA